MTSDPSTMPGSVTATETQSQRGSGNLQGDASTVWKRKSARAWSPGPMSRCELRSRSRHDVHGGVAVVLGDPEDLDGDSDADAVVGRVARAGERSAEIQVDPV